MPTPVYVLAGQSNALALDGRNDGMTPEQVYAALTGSTAVSVATVAADGAPLTFGRPEADWFNPGELLAQLADTVMAQLSQQGTTLASILWVQGEGDTWSCARASEYAARFTAMVDRLEAMLEARGADTANFHITVLALSAEAPEAQDRAWWEVIRAQQLALSDPRITVIDPDAVARSAGLTAAQMFQPDGLHYAAAANGALLGALLQGKGLNLIGTASDDRLAGLGAADTLRGGGGRDLLNGQGGDDTIGGWRGDDTILGGAEDDRIASGAGRDQVWGGAGADTFLFLPGEDMRGLDRLMDFTRGQDVIDLSCIDADAARAGNQAFRWLGASGPDLKPGALWITADATGLTLRADTTGDGVAELTVSLRALATLSAADFLL